MSDNKTTKIDFIEQLSQEAVEPVKGYDESPDGRAATIESAFQDILDRIEPISPDTWRAMCGIDPMETPSLIGKTRGKILAAAARVYRDKLEESPYSFVGIDRQQLHFYTGTHWTATQSTQFKAHLSRSMQKMGLNTLDSEYWRNVDDFYTQFLQINNVREISPKAGIGIFNLANKTVFVHRSGKVEIREHRKEDKLTYCRPFSYDPEAKAPLWERFLNEAVPDKASQDNLAEYIGYCFIKGLDLKKILFCVGPPDTGKSVFFNVTTALFGRENTASQDLTALTDPNNRFGKAAIDGKMANYCSDIDKQSIRDLGMFKRLASGGKEPIYIEEKNKQGHDSYDYAKLIFNCNTLPAITTDDATFSRFLIIRFDNFVPEEKRDRYLSDKIIENELPGVLNWAIAGLNRIFQNKGFTENKKAAAALKRYRKEADTVALFLEESYLANAKTAQGCDGAVYHEITAADLFRRFRDYCAENGRVVCSNQTFYTRLDNLGFSFFVRHKQKMLGLYEMPEEWEATPAEQVEDLASLDDMPEFETPQPAAEKRTYLPEDLESEELKLEPPRSLDDIDF